MWENLYHLLPFRLNGILPVLVCAEIISIIMLCRKNGIWFRGGGLIFMGMIFFFLGAFSNLLTSFGFLIVPAGSDGSFTIHPTLWIAQRLIYIPAWILCGIGIYIWYHSLVKKREDS